MKKLIVILCVILFSCTENERAKSFGGTATKNLEKGQKLVLLTWKEADLWYLTEPMDSAYVPKTYKFQEESSFGIWEGTVIITETR